MKLVCAWVNKVFMCDLQAGDVQIVFINHNPVFLILCAHHSSILLSLELVF